MIYTYITWPSDFATTTFGIMGDLVGDFSTPLTMILGVLIFALVLAILFGAFKH